MNYKNIDRPQKHEYASYFQRYIDLVPDENIVKSLENQLNEAILFYKILDNSKIDYRYVPEKWSIKEVIVHILDTECIFTYRALRFLRKDNTPLPGFEQDDYINNIDWDKYPFLSILEGYELIRKHTITFFNLTWVRYIFKTAFDSAQADYKSTLYILGGLVSVVESKLFDLNSSYILLSQTIVSLSKKRINPWKL